MRPIKFRRVFQHSETGSICMIIWGNVDQEDNDSVNFNAFKSPATISRWFPIADEQFIGIFDKNNKEIYEGDIWEGPMDYGPAGSIITRIQIPNIIPLTDWCNYGEWEKGIVLGNIHENSDLSRQHKVNND